MESPVKMYYPIEYPCERCVVRACCSDWCKELMLDNLQIAIHIFSTNQCPDCGTELNTLPQMLNGRPYYDTDAFVCYPCEKVFVERNADHEPKADYSYTPVLLLEDLKDDEEHRGVQRLAPLPSRHVIQSMSNEIKLQLLEAMNENREPGQVRYPPSHHVNLKVSYFRLFPKILQTPIANETSGDLIVKVRGKWVSKYENEHCESGSTCII